MVIKLGYAKPFFLILLLLLLFLTIISYSVVVHHSKIVPISHATISERVKSAVFSLMINPKVEISSTIKPNELRNSSKGNSVFPDRSVSPRVKVHNDTIPGKRKQETGSYIGSRDSKSTPSTQQKIRDQMQQTSNRGFKTSGVKKPTKINLKNSLNSNDTSGSEPPSPQDSKRLQKTTPKEKVREENCTSCFSNNFSLVINEESLCDKFTDLDLLLLISTGMDRFQDRMAVRETWGQLCTVRNKLACVFTLGSGTKDSLQRKIVSESKLYRDMIQFDFKDSYTNLTYKTMSSFRWAAVNCPRAKFVMKTDTDMYVNTENLPIMLAKGAPRTNFMGGFCWVDSAPHRSRDSKWYVSFRSYSQPRFPPMCSGTGYILSNDAVAKLLNISKNIPYFHLEDVYVAICMKKLKIKPTNLFGFHNVRIPFDSCKYRNALYTSHEIDPYMLRRYWNESRTCTKQKTEPQKLYYPIPLHIP